MEEDERRQHGAERSENTIHDHPADYNKPQDTDIGQTPSSGTDVDSMEQLEKIRTSRSVVRQQQFEPIHSGDREQIARVASVFRTQSQATRNSTTDTNLGRRDTIYGLELGQPVLDPESPEFDSYKWARM